MSTRRSISEVSNYPSSEAIETVIERNRGLGRDDFPVFYDGWRTLDNGAIRKSQPMAFAWYHRPKSVHERLSLGYR